MTTTIPLPLHDADDLRLARLTLEILREDLAGDSLEPTPLTLADLLHIALTLDQSARGLRAQVANQPETIQLQSLDFPR